MENINIHINTLFLVLNACFLIVLCLKNNDNRSLYMWVDNVTVSSDTTKINLWYQKLKSFRMK